MADNPYAQYQEDVQEEKPQSKKMSPAAGTAAVTQGSDPYAAYKEDTTVEDTTPKEEPGVLSKIGDVASKADTTITEGMRSKPTDSPVTAFGKTLGREVYEGAKTVGGMVPGAVSAFTAEPQTDEEKKTAEEHPIVGQAATGLKRILVDPISNAADWYKKAYMGKIPNAYEQALSVAPEAMGSGAGNVVVGKLGEMGVEKGGQMVSKHAPLAKEIATAPIRGAAKAINVAKNNPEITGAIAGGAAGATHGPIGVGIGAVEGSRGGGMVNKFLKRIPDLNENVGKRASKTGVVGNDYIPPEMRTSPVPEAQPGKPRIEYPAAEDVVPAAEEAGRVGNEFTPEPKGVRSEAAPTPKGALGRIEYAEPTPKAEPKAEGLVGNEHTEGMATKKAVPAEGKARIEYATPTKAAEPKEAGLVGNEHIEGQAPAGEAKPRNPVQGVEYGEQRPAAKTPDKEITADMVKSSPGTSMAKETVGTEEGAHSDTAHVAQAKAELGEGASTSQVLQRAQQLKDEAANKPKPISQVDPKEIADYHNEHRGFTYNQEKGFMKDQPGFSVAGEHPELEKTYKEQNVTPEQIKEYINDPKVQAALKADPRNSVGGWVHNGETHLEVSKLLDNKEEAIAEGKRLNQIEVFDHATKQGIPTGGTGEAPKPIEAPATEAPKAERKPAEAPKAEEATPVTEDEAREALRTRKRNSMGSRLVQLEAHETNGGSTFTPEGDNLMGQDKYSVGSYPERTVSLDNLSDADLKKFKADNTDLLKQPDHGVGTWKDPDTGKHVLDVVKLFTDRDEAIAAGKAANQKGIYGLKNGEYIETGGTGEAPKLESPATAAEPKTAEAPKAKEGTTEKANAASESKVTPEDTATVNNVIKDLGEQDIIKAGKKYDVDHEQYDFKKRDEGRHRVERDQYAKDLTKTIPDDMRAKLVKAAQEFDDEDSSTFTDAERSSASRANRAKAIWDKAHEPGFDEVNLKAKGPAPEATSETAKMSDEELLAHGFTKEDIEAGKHLPSVGGAAKGKATGTDIIPEEANKYLREEERQGLKSDLGRRSFVDKLKKLPKVQEFVDAALKGEGGRKWYQRSAAAFDALAEEAPRYFKEGDRNKFTDFVASLSPQQTVTMNLKEALNAWTKYVDAGRPEGKALERLLYQNTTLPEAKVPNAMKALAGEELWPDVSKSAAFKVPSFARNLKGYLDNVTNDGWQALFGGMKADDISRPTSYHPLSVATRAAAEALGWEPAEAQAAIWAFTKAFTEHGETDPHVIRMLSEDFADIMAHDPEVRDMLAQLGVDHEQLDAKLASIGEKPAVTGRTTPTTENSIRQLGKRVKAAGRDLPKPKDQRSLDFSREGTGAEPEGGSVEFNPEEFGKKPKETTEIKVAEGSIPLNKLYDRSAVLVSPEGKLLSVDEYDPRSESPQHPELLRKSGYKGDMTKFLKEGGVRAFTTGPDEAGVEVQNDSPATITRALRVIDGLGRDNNRLEIADPKTFRTTFSAEGTYDQIRNALANRK